MTVAITDRSAALIVFCVLALALRPVGWFASAVTLIVGAAAAISTVSPVRAPVRLAWPVTVGIGVAAFVFVRLRMTAPPVRTTAVGVAVSLAAAVAEELFFRRVVYDRFARWGAFAAVVGAAALFAVVHAPAYGVAVVPLDFAAGLLFGWQRWASSTWTAPAATHVAANLVQVL